MASIHGLKHVESLYAANLTHKDSIRTHTQRILQKISLRYFALSFQRCRSGFKPNDKRLIESEFCRILNGDDAFITRNVLRKRIEHCGFA